MIRIGTSGYSFEDWKGSIYPNKISPQRMFRYYRDELGFNSLELNFSYYSIPSIKSIRRFSIETGDDFSFCVKAFHTITHLKHGQTAAEDNIIKFRDSLQPLRDSSKLAAILFQFPTTFGFSQSNKEYILRLRDYFKDNMAVELRSGTWMRDNTFRFLESNSISYCIADLPPIKALMPTVYRATSDDMIYIRLHGRNRNWFKSDKSIRYDYFYSRQELSAIADEVKKLSKSAKDTHIFFNNCHAGSAAANAKSLMDLLDIEASTKYLDLF